MAQLYPDYPYDQHDPIVTRGAIAEERFDQDAEPGRRKKKDEPRAGARVLTQAAATLAAVPGTMGGADRDGIGSNSWVVGGRAHGQRQAAAGQRPAPVRVDAVASGTRSGCTAGS